MINLHFIYLKKHLTSKFSASGRKPWHNANYYPYLAPFTPTANHHLSPPAPPPYAQNKSRLRYLPPPAILAATQFNAYAYESNRSQLGNGLTGDCIKPQRLYDPLNSSFTSSTNKDPAASLWHSILALPFDDQKLGRRELSTCGRSYAARAGFFSNNQSAKSASQTVQNFSKEIETVRKESLDENL